MLAARQPLVVSQNSVIILASGLQCAGLLLLQLSLTKLRHTKLEETSTIEKRSQF